MKKLERFSFDSETVLGFPDALVGNNVYAHGYRSGGTYKVLHRTADNTLFLESIDGQKNNTRRISSVCLRHDEDIAYKFSVVPPTIDVLWRHSLISMDQIKKMLSIDGVDGNSVVLLIPKIIYIPKKDMYTPFPEGIGSIAVDVAARMPNYYKATDGIIPAELKRL